MSRMLRLTPQQLAAMTANRKQPVATPPKRPKYGNRKTERDGIVFDSAKEAKRYQELMTLYRAGEISSPARQMAFVLPGRIVYRADFVYLDRHTGVLIVEDCKGMRTREYVMKRKLMQEGWGITIKET